MKEEKITAYKAFTHDMKCNGFQYEIGKEYEHDGAIKICESGFHACENPLEVLDYYPLIDDFNLTRFCEVEQSGKIQREKNTTKTCASKIAIKGELSFAKLVNLSVEWVLNKTKRQLLKIGSSGDYALIGSSGGDAKIGSSGYGTQIGSSGNYAQIGSSGNCTLIGSSGYGAKIGSSGNGTQIGSSGGDAKIGSSGYGTKIGSSGDHAQIGSSGNYAQIGSSGNYAKIGSSGYGAQIKSEGTNSVICCADHDSVVSAKKGSWITLAEWQQVEDGEIIPKCVKTEFVDGERIKADTPYKLINGEFMAQV